MIRLTNEQLENVSGGILPLLPLFGAAASGATIGVLGNYVSGTVSQPSFQFNNYTTWVPSFNSYNPSWQSLTYSATVGAISGGVSGSLVGAAGGGLLGNLAWKPGFLGLNFGVQSSNPYK